MKKFEYDVRTVVTGSVTGQESLKKCMNDFGNQGWEVFGVISSDSDRLTTVYMKRELQCSTI